MAIGGRMAKILSDATDKHLTDCFVTFGASCEWAGLLRQPRSPRAEFASGCNIKIRGKFEHYFQETQETEGAEISVEIETLVPIKGSQRTHFLRHYDRLIVDLDHEADLADKPRIVHEIREIRLDGYYRTLLLLHPLGPLCPEHSLNPPGYPYTFPMTYGAAVFHDCAKLNVQGKPRAA